MKTLQNFGKFAAMALMLGTFGNVDALSYNSGTKISSSTGEASTVEGHGQQTIEIGLKVEEVYSVTNSSYESLAPKADGTYDAGKVGELSISYTSNTPGVIQITPSHANFSRNGNTSSVSYHFERSEFGGEATILNSAGQAFNSLSVQPSNGETPSSYVVDVVAGTAVTLGGTYSDTVTIKFIPDSVAD